MLYASLDQTKMPFDTRNDVINDVNDYFFSFFFDFFSSSLTHISKFMWALVCVQCSKQEEVKLMIINH